MKNKKEEIREEVKRILHESVFDFHKKKIADRTKKMPKEMRGVMGDYETEDEITDKFYKFKESDINFFKNQSGYKYDKNDDSYFKSDGDASSVVQKEKGRYIVRIIRNERVVSDSIALALSGLMEVLKDIDERYF